MTSRTPFTWRPRHWVLLGMWLSNIALFLFFVGAWAFTAQHERVLDEDTGEQCLNALANEQLAFAFDYRLGEARFEGPNTLVAAYTWEGTSTDYRPGPEEPRGTVRCTVAAQGDTIDDPLVVTRIEIGPPEAAR